jgi:hypothetical protein
VTYLLTLRRVYIYIYIYIHIYRHIYIHRQTHTQYRLECSFTGRWSKSPHSLLHVSTTQGYHQVYMITYANCMDRDVCTYTKLFVLSSSSVSSTWTNALNVCSRTSTVSFVIGVPDHRWFQKFSDPATVCSKVGRI